MSLSLRCKKAFTKVFDGRDTDAKAGVAVISTLALPIASAVAYAFGGIYSDVRTPELGDKQYASLSAEIDTLAEKDKKLQQEVSILDGLTQQLVYNPNDQTLRQKLETARVSQVEFRKKLDTEVTDFRSRLLLSEGISEKDAIALVDQAESKTSYTLSPNDRDFRQRFQYLDECQITGQREAMQTGASISDQAWNVQKCQMSHMNNKEVFSSISGVFGVPATGFLLFGLSSLGAAFRRQIPAQEYRENRRDLDKEKKRAEKKGPKAVTTTLKVTYTPDK